MTSALSSFVEHSANPVLQELTKVLLSLDWSWVSTETNKVDLLSYQIFILQKVFYQEYLSIYDSSFSFSASSSSTSSNPFPKLETSPPSPDVDNIWHAHLLRPVSYLTMCNQLILKQIELSTHSSSCSTFIIPHYPESKKDPFLLKCRRSKLRIQRTLELFTSPETGKPHIQYLFLFDQENKHWLSIADEEESYHHLFHSTPWPEGQFPVRFRNTFSGKRKQLFARRDDTIKSLISKLISSIELDPIEKKKKEHPQIFFLQTNLNDYFQQQTTLENMGITPDLLTDLDARKEDRYIEYYFPKDKLSVFRRNNCHDHDQMVC